MITAEQCKLSIFVSFLFTFLFLQLMVAGCLATQLKPHQWEGVRFLWSCIVMDFEVCKLCHLDSGLMTAFLHNNDDMWAESQSGTQARQPSCG